MNENSDPAINPPEQPASLQHEKTITPLNPGVRPEEPVVAPPSQPDAVNEAPVPAAQYPQPQPSSGVLAPANEIAQPTAKTEEAKPFKAGRFWAGKMIRLLVAGFVGFFIGGAYSQYWDGDDILTRAAIATDHYSPVVLGTPITSMIPTIIVVVVYGLILRFFLRSKYGLGQAMFAVTASELLIIGLLGVEHYSDKGVNIFGGAVDKFTVVAAAIGIVIFVIANYMAERVWTWKISRAVLAVSFLAIITLADFGLSWTIKAHYDTREQKEQTQSNQAKKESDAGVYNFEGGYQQYYPSTLDQDKFMLLDMAGPAVTPSGEAKNYPHATMLLFQAKKFIGVTGQPEEIWMWQSKTRASYAPPNSCGTADPTQEYYNQKFGISPDNAPCYKIQEIPGVGTLYGRSEKGETIYKADKASNTYNYYYVLRGETLLTIKGVGRINGADAAALFQGMSPISSSDLLAKSEDLATSQK